MIIPIGAGEVLMVEAVLTGDIRVVAERCAGNYKSDTTSFIVHPDKLVSRRGRRVVQYTGVPYCHPGNTAGGVRAVSEKMELVLSIWTDICGQTKEDYEAL